MMWVLVGFILIVLLFWGLSGKHHGELNRGSVPDGRYDELRGQYADDPIALQQIDVYDGKTEYHEKLREFRDAMKSGDVQIQARVESWMGEHYPDI